ncbi:MAG TPA: hypothetical protein VMJ92_02480, partial [Candidatus Limnocylindrales bacterium]|nr:hypothetical protein [Candidatus Limnocylindrales bacterium]
VGHTSGITGTLQADLQRRLPPLRSPKPSEERLRRDERVHQERSGAARPEAEREEEEGHLTEGRAPGGESRWSRGRELEWIPVRPEIVCEVRYDKMEAERFRHGTRFLRFRPDKEPRECTWTQVRPRRRRGDPTLDDLLVAP